MAKHQLKPFTIYCGDNLKMLNEIPNESVDLIYIDPPFNSNRNYEVFWGDAQEKRAFNDRFGDAQAYITYMRPRVNELYRVLKKTGSFYYHCDWHASHYVKVMLDEIFGANFFQNEIIWKRTSSHNDAKNRFGNLNDSIFFYSKGNNFFFNRKYQPYDKDYIRTFYKYVEENGRKFQSVDSRSPNPRPNLMYDYKGYKPHPNGWAVSLEKMKEMDEKGLIIFPKKQGGRIRFKKYLDEMHGLSLGNIWDDIKPLQGQEKERLGYPTQKPISLLERIIEASSNKGDLVLDAFCGCGTTLVAAQKLNRKWIGIDISPTACRVMSQRLWDIFKLDEGKDFSVEDLPHTEEELRKIPHFEFENWAVIALGGIPNKTKVGDFGIDGKLYPISLEKKKKTGSDLFGESDIYYPIQVKQKDKASRPDIDSFVAAMIRDGRRKGYFISFDFTKDAVDELKRLDKKGEMEIIPISVKELLRRETFGVFD
ncbi:MAG: restriction endonuclease [Chitinophagales bacterium]|nr:restriction endonuclease [Chitinophagales bacterium]